MPFPVRPCFPHTCLLRLLHVPACSPETLPPGLARSQASAAVARWALPFFADLFS